MKAKKGLTVKPGIENKFLPEIVLIRLETEGVIQLTVAS